MILTVLLWLTAAVKEHWMSNKNERVEGGDNM